MNLQQKLQPIREKLQKAIELELSTIPPYLVAMFSIKPGNNTAASNLIRSVFMEEMLHMVLAANTLSAIGGKVKLGRDNIPVYPCRLKFQGKEFLNREFDVHLAALSKDTLNDFMQIELPEFMERLKTVELEAILIEGFTIGEFYQGIKDELKTACETYGEQAVFSGDTSLQVSEQYYWSGAGKPIVVSNLQQAIDAIDVIVKQGEGAEIVPQETSSSFFSALHEVPHYFRFKEIYEGRYYQKSDDPAKNPTGAVLPVDYEGVYPLKPDCKGSEFAEQPELRYLNNLFNANYIMMLSQIEEGFNGNPKAFYTAIMDGMHNLTPVARNMVQIPVAGDPQNRHGAPSFEWIDNN
jgi:hypothetical protein